MAMLDVKNISKSFGATRVLEDISFSLEQGQALAIIGSSGSGKTTMVLESLVPAAVPPADRSSPPAPRRRSRLISRRSPQTRPSRNSGVPRSMPAS